MTRPRIAVIGSANIDLVTSTDVFPKPGETIFGKSFDLGFGGKGANQAVAARLCGAHVDMVAKVGSDLFGPATIKNFESFGIDVTHVRAVAGVSSGVAPIFVDSAGQNRILVVKGANDHLRPEDVDLAAPILKKSDCILLQFEIPLETVYYAIRFANANGIRCIVNPAPALPIDVRAFRDVDYLIPNESEAEKIAGASVQSVEEARRCAASLVKDGPANVIITMGAAGVLLATRTETRLVEAYPVNTTDTTGAGDAFIGSFATFWLQGHSAADAISRACIYAALSTTKAGTQKSFPSRSEFDRHFQQMHG
jgi:ribokinase